MIQENVIKDLMSKENLREVLASWRDTTITATWDSSIIGTQDIHPLPRWLVMAMRNPWVQDVEMSKENDLIQENWHGNVEPCGLCEEASNWRGSRMR